MIHRWAATGVWLLFASWLSVGCGGGGAPPLPAPSALSYPSPQSLVANTAMTPIVPGVTGQVASFAVTPALPAGLALNTTTGQISGTPLAAAGPATYTVTASNSSGATSFVLSLKVITVEVESGRIERIVAQGAPIELEVTIRPVHFEPGTIHASASDSNGLFLPGVAVTPEPNGSYLLRLSTNPSIAPSLFTGSVTIALCRDAGCTSRLDVPSITVPVSVRVMGANTPWPGNNLTPLAAWPGAPEWTTVQGNASHTGHVPVRANPDRFTLRWKTTGNSVWSPWTALKQNLVTSDGLLYVVSSEYLAAGVLMARREFDGSEAWRYEVSGMSYPSANPATVAGGVVYLAVGHQQETYLVARRAADGAAVYRSSMASQWESYHAPTVGPNGMVYANAGTYGGLFAFNPTGVRLFFSQQSFVSNWTPAVTTDAVFAYTGDRLQVLDPLTGIARLTIEDPTFQNYIYDAGGAPVIGNATIGSVFGAAYSNAVLNGGDIGNSLTNFRTPSASIAWQVRGAYPTTPAYKAGVLYAVNHKPLRLEARAEEDGALLWSWTPASASETQFVSEVLVTDNLVFVSTNQTTHAIDLRARRPVWGYPASGKLALSANGVLYIHNTAELIAINLK